ncbi:TadE/TadG family type IV pilus assembly protein [Qipengyuania atrilutea]|uniref:Pilus assembly protein n=1 Tax=Qipengyuania atrilutea TaxID=2744473 RepID=A0A850GZM1_9SPHN|nr:TadE/TadG family type IV pilus assembly protein [Actirhodobacter atriluteus]NVD43847.1 pilus assembly protein [Actirhodobacter atriluteus]
MIGLSIVPALLRDKTGSFAIETAFAAPVLITLALGTFEIGSIVSRQQELQSAALEGETIALAVNQGAEIEVSELEAIIRDSVGLTDDQVTIERFYRCDADAGTVADPLLCNTADEDAEIDPAMSAATADGETGEAEAEPIVSSYIRIRLQDTYTPVWTNFGVGEPLEFNVDRSVMLS